MVEMAEVTEDVEAGGVASNNGNSNSQSSSQSSGSGVLPFGSQKLAVTLTYGNYLFWRQHMLLVIKSHKLSRFIDGTALVPDRLVKDTSGRLVVNPLYEDHEQLDACLASWILGSVSQSLQSQLVGYSSARQIWLKLESSFSAKTDSTVMRFRSVFHSQRKGDLSMKAYISAMKNARDQLNDCGDFVSDSAYKTAVVHGLPPDYSAEAAVILGCPQSFTVESMENYLYDAEARQQQVLQHLTVSANLAAKSPFSAHGGQLTPGASTSQGLNPGMSSSQSPIQASVPVESMPQYNFRGEMPTRGGRNNFRGGGRYGSSRPQCQLCGKIGHLVTRCYHRFDQSFQGIGAFTGGFNGPAATAFTSSVAQGSGYATPTPRTAYYTAPPHQFSSPSPSPYVPQYVHAYLAQQYVPQQYHTSPSPVRGIVPSSGFPASASLPGSSTPQIIPGLGLGPSTSPNAPAPHPFTSSSSQPFTAHVSAPIATPDIVADNAWHPDSRATNHVTSSLSNLETYSPYEGAGTIVVGNGHYLPIHAIGHS